MNPSDFEARLRSAAAVAAAPRSIVEEVMGRIPASAPQAPSRPAWSLVAIAGFAVPGAIAATLAFLLFSSGPAVGLTLADLQAAVERQAWAHVRFDAGQFQESWTNLQTGEAYTTRTDGSIVYVNEQTNTRLWYSTTDRTIRQDAPRRFAPGEVPPIRAPQTAWEKIVAPLEQAENAANPADAPPTVVSARDTLDGKPVVRFDRYGLDSLGNRMLFAQLWADPSTRLPVRIRTRLQFAERKAAGKEWSIGDYDFPASGPADLYALGVPRDAAIVKEAATALPDVQTVLEAIDRAHDGFLRNYRAVVWSLREGSSEPFDGLDIIWRDGEKVRQDHHLPAFERQFDQSPPLPEPTPPALLAWSAKGNAAVRQLLDGEREYTWRSAEVAKTPTPQVQIIRHGRITLLDTNDWPERILWPTHGFTPDFRVLEADGDAVAGCIGLRR